MEPLVLVEVPLEGPPLVDPEPLCATIPGASNVPKTMTVNPNLVALIKSSPLNHRLRTLK